MRVKYTVSRTMMYLIMVLLAIIFIFPVAWAFISSLKPEAQIVSYPLPGYLKLQLSPIIRLS